MLEKLKAALKKRETVVICAKCSIAYSGRAESYLPEGERIIIIKEDTSVIVHQPLGNNPVNYMKPPTSFKIAADNNHLHLACINEALKENLEITLLQIYFLESKKLEDAASLVLQGSERHFSDYIYQHPSLIEQGFKPLSREEHTKYGFIDIFGYDQTNTLVVIECKRFKAGPDAVTQLRRYVERIKKDKGLSKVRGMVIAPSITKNALDMLADYGYTYKQIDPPNYLENHKKNQKQLGEY
ncbi:DUF91 domain-containing protein [Candidatus Woesearchaeota archaeon]|nr:MAG: DUF91 domain-containing protein [Candidatus Woesearchaeota archaeon]